MVEQITAQQSQFLFESNAPKKHAKLRNSPVVTMMEELQEVWKEQLRENGRTQPFASPLAHAAFERALDLGVALQEYHESLIP